MIKSSDIKKVDRDFVLKRIGLYINLAKKSKKNIYGKDYSIIHNDNALIGEHIEILIENKSIMVPNIEIKRNTISFARYSGECEILNHFKYLEIEEEASFKIYLDTKIQILVLPEQRNIFSRAKLNITYPISDIVPNYSDWQQNEFVLESLIEKKIEGHLFYEANLVFKNMEREITNLRYFYKTTLKKHFLIPKEEVLKYYEYEE